MTLTSDSFLLIESLILFAMWQIGRIQDDTVTRSVLMSDDVKVVRCPNTNSDAKMKKLVLESISKQ